ncbi:YtxH domain-containing protein [Priestia megaterium]|nr:YtxH domain-containing protein [Priestia megaterium]
MKEENVKQTAVKESKGNKELLVGTLVGSVVGVATALLVAPKSGKELRASIQDQANQALLKTGQVKETVYAKGQDLKQRTARLSQVVSEQSTQVVNKVKSLRPAKQELEAAACAEPAEELVEETANEEPALAAENQVQQELEIIETEVNELEQSMEEVNK